MKQKRELTHGLRVYICTKGNCLQSYDNDTKTNTSAFTANGRDLKMKIVTFSLITFEMLSSALLPLLHFSRYSSLHFIYMHLFAFEVCISCIEHVHTYTLVSICWVVSMFKYQHYTTFYAFVDLLTQCVFSFAYTLLSWEYIYIEYSPLAFSLIHPFIQSVILRCVKLFERISLCKLNKINNARVCFFSIQMSIIISLCVCAKTGNAETVFQVT